MSVLTREAFHALRRDMNATWMKAEIIDLNGNVVDDVRSDDAEDRDDTDAANDVDADAAPDESPNEVSFPMVLRLTQTDDGGIDLSRVPSGKLVRLELHTYFQSSAIRLVGLGPGATVALSVPNIERNESISTLSLHDCLGQVSVLSMMPGVRLSCTRTAKAEPPADARGGKCSAPEPEATVVLHSDVSMSVRGGRLTTAAVVLDGGRLWVESHIDRVVLVADSYIGDSGSVARLEVTRDALLTVGPDSPEFGEIVGLGGDSRAQLDLNVAVRPKTDPMAYEPVQVEHIVDVDIVATDAPAHSVNRGHLPQTAARYGFDANAELMLRYRNPKHHSRGTLVGSGRFVVPSYRAFEDVVKRWAVRGGLQGFATSLRILPSTIGGQTDILYATVYVNGRKIIDIDIDCDL